MTDLAVIGRASPRLKRQDIDFELVRVLVPEDIPKLLEPPPQQAGPATTLVSIRHAHHKIAQALAQGHQVEHVALMQGYSPSYISRLRHDPAFAELVEYYENLEELAFVDVKTRMKDAGLTAMDELQARLAEDPKGWSRRELMEYAELMLGKGGASPTTSQTGQGTGPGISINVNFATPPATPSGPVIDQDGPA